MIVSTHNCAKSVLVENGMTKSKFMGVQKLADIDKVEAIKRKQSCNNEKLDRGSEEKITYPPKKKQFFGNNN